MLFCILQDFFSFPTFIYLIPNSFAQKKMILERKILFAIEQLKKESKINNKPIWDLKDVMFITSYSESKLYKLTSSAEIPFFKKGKKLYFEPAKVLAWLKEDNTGSDAEEFKEFQNKKNNFL